MLLIAFLLAAPSAWAADASDIVIRKWLVVSFRTSAPSGAFQATPVAQRFLLGQKTRLPAPGELEKGMKEAWAEAQSDEKGKVSHRALSNGYAVAMYEASEDGVYLATGHGHYRLYINGEGFSGDVYRRKYGPTVVRFRKGKNLILIRVVRGGFTMRFVRPTAPLMLFGSDNTLPDVRQGKTLDAPGAVLLANARNLPAKGVVIETSGEGFVTTRTPVGYLAPLAMRKAAFRIRVPSPLGPREEKELPLRIRVVSAVGIHEIEVKIGFRKGTDSYRETFVSDIDGSVQYFGVRPPWGPVRGRGPLFLSLHGASVEAAGQARAYSSKPQGWVVAATNRRPFGFDWEDWGRLDALEVLSVFQSRYPVDENRVYLTGHSMGGHGTWHLGVNHPGLFAAIGPSAGWISFATYSRRSRPTGGGYQEFFSRGQGASDTFALQSNLRDLGVFIIHGSVDDNVPVDQSRRMVKELRKFHRDFVYREFPGKKHWWDESKEQGTDCVDLAELFDFFARRRRARAPRSLAFKTASPGVSSRHRWLKVLGQEKLLALSEVTAVARPGLSRIELTTKNITRLAVDPKPLFQAGPITFVLDGREVGTNWDGKGELVLCRQGKEWALGGRKPSHKNPSRYGPFKTVFVRRFVMVYGTGGTAEENAATLARARYDAHLWWYQGNGSCDLLPDTEFKAQADPHRNVILYGHADMNSAWTSVLGHGAVTLKRGEIVLNDKTLEGENISCLFIRPRKGSDRAMVGVVGGTGLEGIRGTMLGSYFRSGTQYPDVTVWAVPGKGEALPGILAVGFFESDWSSKHGEWWLNKAWKAPVAKGEDEDDEGEDF